MDLIATLHAKMYHAVYLMAGLSVIFPLISLITKKPLNKYGKLVIRVYSIQMTIQVVLGLINLISRWNDFGDGLRFRLEHATIMIVALALVHIAPRFMRRDDAVGRRNTLLMMVASITLVLLGVTLIQGVAHPMQ